MPTKKTHGNSTAKRGWEEYETNELLACLDYHKGKFARNVLAHLKKTTGRDFSKKQIWDKLRRLWANYGRHDSRSFQDLLDEGSAVLTGYLPEDHERIREATRRIEHRIHAARARMTARGAPASHGRSLRSRATSRPPPQLSEPPLALPLDVSGPLDSSRGEQLGRSTAHAGFGHSAAPEAKCAKCYVDAAAQTPPTVEGTRDSAAQAIEALRQELTMKTRENAEQGYRIFRLANELAAAKKRSEEDQHVIKRAMDKTDDPIATQMALQRINLSLETSLKALRCQINDFTRFQNGKSALGPGEPKIQEQFNAIMMEIYDAFGLVKTAIPANDALALMDSDVKGFLNKWVSKLVQDCTLEQFLAPSSLERIGVSDEEVVQSLAAAGLCDLVFGSCFPQFVPTESPLLDQYRKHLLVRGGPDWLCEFDLVAHKSLMAEAYFDTLITERAGQLFEQLCAALEPFLAARDDDDDDDGLGSRGVSSASPPSPRERGFSESQWLRDALARALRLKADLLLADRRYKLVFVRHGDRFCPGTMSLDAGGGGGIKMCDGRELFKSEIQDGAAPAPPVKLCVFPALCAGPAGSSRCGQDEHGDPTEVARHVVNSQNFVEGESGDGFVLVTKAVVLV